MFRQLTAGVLVLTATLSLFGLRQLQVAQQGAATPLKAILAQETLTTVATPSVPPGLQPPLNFTRAEYEAALAKWRAQEATEYEMVVHLLTFSAAGGTWRLRVSVREGVETITEFERVTEGNGFDVGVESLTGLTVGALFRQVDEVLQEVEGTGGGNSPPVDPEGLTNYYRATFHSELGYPTSFGGAPNLPPGQEAFDAAASIKVHSLTILQQRTVGPPGGPGMPRTGHPGR
ncbi:MAG TPA: hypothetical protein VF952_05350 [Chloroflexia bacterium]